jgi:hypothetical protein
MKGIATLSLATGSLLCLVATFTGDPVGLLERAGGHTTGAAFAQAPAEPLSANDISWLFPAPVRSADLTKLISMSDLTANGDPVWSDHAFHQFLAIASGQAGAVAGTMHRINLPADAWTKGAWYISGVRFDPGAPSLDPEITKKFGRAPQIRLSVQPVTRTADGMLKVQDIAAHLAFSFTMERDGLPDTDVPAEPGCLPRPKADVDKFKAIVADLVALRDAIKPDVTTAGLLGVHPGLKKSGAATSVRDKMKALLERHLSGRRLTLMAIAALSEEPSNAWIFLPMFNMPAGIDPSMPVGGFVAVRGPALDGAHFAQLFSQSASQNKVIPAPYPNNRYGRPTCRHAALPIGGLPIEDRDGVSTAPFIDTQPPSDQERRDKIEEMVRIIGDPAKSHMLNTDCVSCHTETYLAINLMPGHAPITGIDSDALPNHQGNVRGLGWFPRPSGDAQPTVSHRVNNDTAAGLDFINKHCLPGGAGSSASQAGTCLLQ